jgi:hypothetical protein
VLVFLAGTFSSSLAASGSQGSNNFTNRNLILTFNAGRFNQGQFSLNQGGTSVESGKAIKQMLFGNLHILGGRFLSVSRFPGKIYAVFTPTMLRSTSSVQNTTSGNQSTTGQGTSSTRGMARSYLTLTGSQMTAWNQGGLNLYYWNSRNSDWKRCNATFTGGTGGTASTSAGGSSTTSGTTAGSTSGRTMSCDAPENSIFVIGKMTPRAFNQSNTTP